jgi:hypothetical protein
LYLALGGGPPGFPRDFSCPAVLGVRLEVHMCFGYGIVTLCDRPFQAVLLHNGFVTSYETPRNPTHASMSGLGYSPFARRYLGNHCCFLFLRVLRCFSSPGVPSIPYGFRYGSYGITRRGFPHSDIPGSKPAYGSPRHFGVRSVLHRHLAPRHSPCALTNLTYAILTIRFGLLCQVFRSSLT